MDKYSKILQDQGFKVTELDSKRPWGGFLRIDSSQIKQFNEIYFKGVKLPNQNLNLSPKILFIEPGKRFSWQVHDRRGELWRVLEGPIIVYLSEEDKLPENPRLFQVGEVIDVFKGLRHRIQALDNWGIVPEIWIHTEPDNPSDEEDIRRIQDDFGR